MTRAVRILNFPCLRVTGPDRVAWLNGLLTCDVARATTERSVWGLLLSKQGKLVAELVIVPLQEDLLIGIRGGDAELVLSTLDRYLVMEDAEIERAEQGLRFLVFARPQGPGEGADLANSRQELLANHPGLLWVGEGFWGASASESSSGLSARAAGRNVRSFGQRSQLGVYRASVGEDLGETFASFGTPMSEQEWFTAQLDWGLPDFGVDFSEADNPHEASLEHRAVDWDKGCYLGQEVVCMQDMRGKVKRRLVVLETVGEVLPGMAVSNGAAALDEEGRELGHVTRASAEGAFASLKAPAYQPGTRVYLRGKSGLQPAVVRALGGQNPS